MSPRKQVRARLEADYLTRRPVDHTAPLPPAVIGRGKDEMTDEQVAALYPIRFEDELMARLAEDGDA